MKIDTSVVCTSIPPMYRCVCPSCNCLDFIKTSEYDTTDWDAFRREAALRIYCSQTHRSAKGAIEEADELIENLKSH